MAGRRERAGAGRKRRAACPPSIEAEREDLVLSAIHTEELNLTRDAEHPAPRITLRLPAGPGPHPLVVVLHGFKGFKDWGFFPEMGMRLARAGFAAAGVDFARNGIGDDPGNFTRLDLFEQNSVGLEVQDVARVIAALAPRPDLALAAGHERLGVLGHSRGGGVALLSARRERRVSAVAGWAAVADFRRRFSSAQIESWRSRGYFEVENARTGQVMRLGRRQLDETLDTSGEFSPLAAAGAVACPVLLVHGSADEAVPPEDTRLLAAAHAVYPTDVVWIADAGHTFGAVHPFAGSTPALEQAIAATIDFFTRTL